jgi:hypothetical protein
MKTPPELSKWLSANLGPRSLAPLTSHDWDALLASVALCKLISYPSAPGELFAAYGSIVSQMQEHTRHLAYHAIACELDWSHRAMIWELAGFLERPTTVCCYEPGGGGEAREKELKKRK